MKYSQMMPLLIKFFWGYSHVMNYLFLVAEECREIMAKLGVRSIPELVGRCELLKPNEAVLKSDPKFANLNLLPLILPAKELRGTILNVRDRDQWLTENHKIQLQDHGLDAEVRRSARDVVPRHARQTVSHLVRCACPA